MKRKMIGLLCVVLVGNLNYSEDIDKGNLSITEISSKAEMTTLENRKYEERNNEDKSWENDNSYGSKDAFDDMYYGVGENRWTLKDKTKAKYSVEDFKRLAEKEKEIKYGTNYLIESNRQKDLEAIAKQREKMQDINKSSASDIVSSLGDMNSITDKFNVEDMLSNVDDLYNNTISKVAETGLGVAGTVVDIAAGTLGLAGSLPTLGGIATVGTNLQNAIQRITMFKNRIDQLKDYKRKIENMKDLSVNELKTLAGLTKNLNSLTGVLNTIHTVQDKTVDYNKRIQNADLTTMEGWEVLLGGENDLRNINDDALKKIAGDDSKKIREQILKAQETLAKVNPKNPQQSLQLLNEQMKVLLTLMNQQLTQDSLKAGSELVKENKQREEEMAKLKTAQLEMEKLVKANQELAEKVEKIELGTHFVGSPHGRGR